jgi:hypothetical protein
VHVTASRWWQRRKAELAPNTRLDYKWRLDYVLRYLARTTTAQLDVHRIDAFRGELEAAGLSPRSVNMVLDLLAQVLDDAVEYGLLEANPARGKRRRLKVPKTSRTFLEPDMLVDLLDVADEGERSQPEHQRYGRSIVQSGAERETRKLAVLLPELLHLDGRRDVGVVGVDVLDRVDGVDAREGGVERVFDAWGRAVGSVEDLPSGPQAALRVQECLDDLLPLLVLHLMPLLRMSNAREAGT